MSSVANGFFLLAGLLSAQQHARPQANGTNGVAPSQKSAPTSKSTRATPSIGNNIVEVINSLLAAGAGKGRGEFETVAQYESRQKTVAAHYGQLVFLVPDAKFAYQADGGEMNLTLVTSDDFFDEGSSEDKTLTKATLHLRSKLVASGSYTGTNGFGATARIRSAKIQVHGVSIDGGSSVPFRHSSDGFQQVVEMAFVMPLDQARALKPFLLAVLVGRLTQARVEKGWHMDLPSLGVPFEIRRDGLFIPLAIEEIRIVDRRSGKPVAVVRGVDQADAARKSEVDLQKDTIVKEGGDGGDRRDSKLGLTEYDPAPLVTREITPLLVRRPHPVYPIQAKQAHIEGAVKVKATIAADGSVVEVELISGHPLLVPAAIEAVKQWIFQPTYRKGRRVSVETILEVSFYLP